MFMISIIGSILFAREIAAYDSRYNDRKFFVIDNKKIANILLPKSIGGRTSVKRKKSDFNKMTYCGAVFYACNLLVLLLIPVFLFLVPEIATDPFEIDSRLLYIYVDTVNEKLPVLMSLILLAVEIVFEFANVFVQARKQNKKWFIVLSIILMIMIALFGLLQVEELIATIIEVF